MITLIGFVIFGVLAFAGNPDTYVVRVTKVEVNRYFDYISYSTLTTTQCNIDVQEDRARLSLDKKLLVFSDGQSCAVLAVSGN